MKSLKFLLTHSLSTLRSKISSSFATVGDIVNHIGIAYVIIGLIATLYRSNFRLLLRYELIKIGDKHANRPDALPRTVLPCLLNLKSLLKFTPKYLKLS